MQTTKPASTEAVPWLGLVSEQVSKLRFGVVQIVVHDSRVVQIERTEKLRLTSSSRDGGTTTVPTSPLEAHPSTSKPTEPLEES